MSPPTNFDTDSLKKEIKSEPRYFQGLFLGNCDTQQAVYIYFPVKMFFFLYTVTEQVLERKSHSLKGNSTSTGSWPKDMLLSLQQGV